MSAARDKISTEGIKRHSGKNNSIKENSKNAGSQKAMAKKQNERVLRKKFEKKQPRLTTIRVLIIAFIFGCLCVGQYGFIQDMGLQINEKQAALKEVNAENEALKQKCAQLSNRSVVKEEATKQLGMTEAETVIVYTPSDTKDSAQ